MSAGKKYEYHWADGTSIKKPIKCSAPRYIDYMMTWVQDQLDDEAVFPSKIGLSDLLTALYIAFFVTCCFVSFVVCYSVWFVVCCVLSIFTCCG